MKTQSTYIPTVPQSHSLTVPPSHRLTVSPSHLLTAIILLIFTLQTIGQTTTGQAKNEEVTIIAPYIPTIGDATKIPFRPEISPAEADTAEFDYSYVTRQVETKVELDPIEPVKYSSDKQQQLYRNYAKVGLGNYATPYIDFHASSLQSESHLVGVRLMHNSSQGKIKGYPPSAYSHNLATVYGKYFTKTHTLSADIGYKRDVVHFYGFKPDSFPDVEFTKEDIKQRFQHFNAAVELASNYKDDDKVNHKFGLGFDYYSDYYETRESQFNFDINVNKKLETVGHDYNHAFSIDLGLNVLNYDDTVKSTNSAFTRIMSVYRFSFAQYRFELGLDIQMANEKAAGVSNFGVDVFPLLKAEVVIVENKARAFASISGNRTINSFRSLTGLNPFIISTPEIKYSDEQIKIGGGISGNAGGMNFLAEAYYSFIKDMPLFVTDTTLEFDNRFNIIYDNVNLLQIRASLGYVMMNELSLRLLGAYYHYIPKHELQAWHMPNFEVGIEAGYSFLDKYTVRASLLALGSKYARTYAGGEEQQSKIKGALDLGIGGEYQVNRMIAVFIDGNNLLNQHYQRWYEYPVQGILVMAGVKISF